MSIAQTVMIIMIDDQVIGTLAIILFQEINEYINM